MNQQGRGKIFTPKKIKEMILLKKAGIGNSELGAHFGVDHSTIDYHWNKHLAEEDEKKNLKPKHKYDHLINEVVNQGKNYRQYLKKR